MPTAASAHQATKIYGTGDTAVVALDHVDLEFEGGRLTSIMGPSGSGKSTLMHCMAGLDRLTSGQVLIGDTDLATLSDDDLTRLRRDRIGFVFQAFNLIPTLSARENIELPARIARAELDADWRDHVIDILGLGPRLEHRPTELSGGQQQRVAAARALVRRPEIIFADEPSGNLDTTSAAELLGFLRRAVDDFGQTIVMVTHDPSAAVYSDRVVFLRDGASVDEIRDPSVESIFDRLKELEDLMIRVALRNLWEHKLRTVLLGLAIVAGVGFVSAAYVFTDSLGAAFDEAFTSGTSTIDIQVAPATAGAGAGSGGEFERISADLVDAVASVDGVAAASPTVQGFVTIVSEAEEQQPFGPPDFAINWTGTGAFEIVEGDAPASPDEVVVDAGTAESESLTVGDTIEVAGSGRAEPFTVVGTFQLSGGVGLGGAGFVAGTLDSMSELLGIEGEVNGIDVVIEEGASLDGVVTAIQSALPDDVEALDAREAAQRQADQLQEGIGFFNTFLLVFGAISLVVGAFVVYNAFRVVVAQRGKELALLRILGTTRRQLMTSVLVEALIVGTIASIVGLGFGMLLAVGIRALLSATGGDLPDAGLVIAPRTVIVAMVVGILTTLASAVVPAARTTRISPMEALRDQPELRRIKPWWAWVGGAVLAASVGLVGTGVVQAREEAALTGDVGPLALIGAGCAAAFVGLFLLARALARPVIGAVGAFARTQSARIGRENARRAPRRTAVTASALMIGLGLVATVAVLSRSVEDTILGALEDSFASEITVAAGGFNPLAGMPVEVADVISEVEGVGAVAPMNAVEVGLPAGGSTLAVGVEPESVDVALAFDDVAGSFADLDPGTLAIQRIEAENRGVGLGDAVDLTVDGEPYPVTVVAIFQFAGGFSDTQSYYLPYDEVRSLQSDPRDITASVAITEGADVDDVAERIESALSDFPSVQVSTISDLVGQVQSALTAVVGMVAGLLLMSVVVAVVGIVLTLYLAVYERTRETGMLRAVGMTRRQVRRMIRFESVLIAIFGTLLGLVLGLFCGWALSVGVVGEGVRFAVPWVWIGFGFVGAVVAGVVAAVVPARRAARMDVLEAIAYE